MSNRLEMEVWPLDDCAGCGLCVATCSKQVLGWNGGGHPVFKEHIQTVGYSKVPLDSCTFCEHFCEETCPRLDKWAALEPQVTISARARGPVSSGAPNDVIKSILTAGRSAGLLDGVVMLDIDPWELKPIARVCSTVEDIVESIGPQFLWAPVFEALNEAIFMRSMQEIAVVGTPCAAQAIRKLRSSHNIRLRRYQEAIRLSVSVFCTGIYKPEMIDAILIDRMGVRREQVKRLEVSPDREWLRAVLWDDSERTIPRQQAESYTRRGCGRCDDYLGESADLAIGTLGAPEGTSTMIIRSRTGDVFTRNAVQMKLLETYPQVDQNALAAAAQEKDKRARAQAFRDLQILMLDSLADPLKRGEAIQQFVRLYRTPMRTDPQVGVRSNCTGC